MYCNEPLLTPAQLKRLDKHKYSAQSDSILDPYMQIWWNTVIEFVPKWMAPNLITIIGLAVNVFTSLLLMYYTPHATEPAPEYVTFLCALGLFIYQTLDAIDGKQARRTGTSSPLGELFDHGCDSVSTVFVTVASACAVSLGHSPYIMLFQCFVATGLFYSAHWQTFVTGTMHFGKVDVTEGQLCIMGFMLLSTVFGPTVWDVKPLGLLPLRYYPTVIGTAAGSISLMGTISTIFKGGAGKNGSTVAGTSVLTPIIPILGVIVPGVWIALESDDHVYETNPILYIFTFGLIAAKVTNKLIVAHMSKSEMSNTDLTLFVPFAFFLNSYFSIGISETLLLQLACFFVCVDLYLYCHTVCLEICNHMGVFLFKIPVAENGSSSSAAGGVTTRSKAASKN